ncbi:hypothetical protein RRG08_028944 [Elysia crispata]|uniref:Uncharacterized protein n=1 Tax=Elysia crispata TaxID=231223 RepID=A0AAE1AR52_9GAST|nr:hypothetical protein RRG08_028944 [Elysia crispata]
MDRKFLALHKSTLTSWRRKTSSPPSLPSSPHTSLPLPLSEGKRPHPLPFPLPLTQVYPYLLVKENVLTPFPSLFPPHKFTLTS